MIIGLTGPAQAGKSTAAKYMVEKYGFKELSLSEQVLDPILKKKKIKVTKMARSELGDELRKKEGMDALAKRLLELIDSPRIVISNFRSPEEVRFFIDRTPIFHLIKIDAEPNARFERRSSIDPNTIDEFLARDKNDMEKKGMGMVFEMVDHKVDNNGDVNHLQEQLDKIMKKIGVTGEESEGQ